MSCASATINAKNEWDFMCLYTINDEGTELVNRTRFYHNVTNLGNLVYSSKGVDKGMDGLPTMR